MPMREIGAKDKIRIESGRIERDVFKGAKVALVAAIPNLLLAVLFTLINCLICSSS